MHYPRLLIISSSAFNPLTGGGITFTNLFRGWPRDRIATVTSDSVTPTADVCEKYYFLGPREFPWAFPFSAANLFHAQEKIEQAVKLAKGAPTRLRSAGSGNVNLLKKAIPSLQRMLGGEIPTNARISPDLRKFIEEFKPDIIYTILGNLPYIRLVREISREFKIPCVIHMMDDWPRVMYRGGILGPVRREKMQRELRDIIKNAAACLGICRAMCDEYEARYGRKFFPFANALESEKWEGKARTDWRAGKPFKIFYGGALMENSQVKSVADVAEIIPELRREGFDAEFHVYAPWYAANRYREPLERNAGVKVFDAPEKMDIESLFAGADLLLLPVNFDTDSVNYIRYSMPTKVPAYMFSGTPTLAYGPQEAASIQYAKEWAHVVSERNFEKLKDALKILIGSEDLRKKFGTQAQALAAAKHDAAEVRKTFHAIFTRLQPAQL